MRIVHIHSEHWIGHGVPGNEAATAQTQKTVDPYHVFCQFLKFVLKQELNIFLNYLLHPAVVNCKQ